MEVKTSEPSSQQVWVSSQWGKSMTLQNVKYKENVNILEYKLRLVDKDYAELEAGYNNLKAEHYKLKEEKWKVDGEVWTLWIKNKGLENQMDQLKAKFQE